eukprot:jgi/Botrbrau1/16710/Bobra.0270s0001.1
MKHPLPPSPSVLHDILSGESASSLPLCSSFLGLPQGVASPSLEVIPPSSSSSSCRCCHCLPKDTPVLSEPLFLLSQVDMAGGRGLGLEEE